MFTTFSHIFNLILKDCINKHYPQEYTKIVKKICHKFSNSPKQNALLQQQQKIENQGSNAGRRPLSIKRFVETRWSSFEEALERIIELNDDL